MPHFYSSDEPTYFQPRQIPYNPSPDSYLPRQSVLCSLAPSLASAFAPRLPITHQMDRRERESSAEQAASPVSRRRASWLDEVGAAPIRRISQKDARRPEALAATHQEQRASPSNLRATAPAFSALPRIDPTSAIIDEDEELDCSMATLRVSNTPLQMNHRLLRNDSPPSLLRYDHRATTPGLQERLAYTSPQQGFPSLTSELTRVSTEPYAPTQPPSLTRTSTQTNQHRIPSLDPRPRALTFSAESLAKLGNWKPDYTMADFRDGSGTAHLHTANSCFAVVEFKMFRAEVYQMRLDWHVSQGVSLVIVEADRGSDLGKVYRLTSSVEEARSIKKQLYRRHWDALLRYSSFQNCNTEDYETCFEAHYNHMASSAHASGFTGSMPPKSIVGVPTDNDLRNLINKEGMEEKAKRDCQAKAKNLNLDMEILAAEFQYDMQKLTLYYLAPHYIPYTALQNEVYKVYKCRLWFSALNPASFYPAPSKGIEPPHLSQGGHRSGDWIGQSSAGGQPLGQGRAQDVSAQHAAAKAYFATNTTPSPPVNEMAYNPLTAPSPWNNATLHNSPYSGQRGISSIWNTRT